MNREKKSSPRAPWVLLLLAAAAAGASGAILRAQEPAVQTEAEPAAEPSLPTFLKGVDLTIPAQDAFKSWPPKEILRRVYWYPWTWYSFQKAALFDRPVLAVVTVSWSRLAQRFFSETLANEEVRGLLDDGFLLVMVDGDRRPDIRDRLQTGTWPEVGFLLPNGDPMLSKANPRGIDQPITTGAARADELAFYLREARTYYERQSSALSKLGGEWIQNEKKAAEPKAGSIDEDATDVVARWLLGAADREQGGFGAAPKFLVADLSEYAALRAARHAPELAAHARLTLTRLFESPLHDSRYGGLHRIAVSPDWKDIQYEKMLEGNVHALRELVFSLRAEDSTALRKTLQETARFLTGVLGRPGGGFFLAQCADPKSEDGGAYWRAPASESPASPPIDRLVLSGENALAGAAMLRAGALLGDEALEKAGRQAVDLVLERAYKQGRGVNHVIEPKPDVDRRYLGAQAETAFGLVDAYESTGDGRYLKAARDVVDFASHNLLDPGETSLRDRLPETNPVGALAIPRHPMPENILIARTLRRLAIHGQSGDLLDRADEILRSFTSDLTAFGVHGTEAALAVEERIRDPLIIRIDGPASSPKTQALRRAALSVSWPWTVVTTGTDEKAGPSATISWAGKEARVKAAEQIDAEARRITAAASEPPR